MEFIDFKRAVYKQFDALANNADRLYLTNVNKDELWDCYIDSYPEDERQSHTCNCCRQFIKPYGNVAITGRFNANVVSVLKKAKELFVTHPEYWGMCFCIEHAMAGTERGITIYSQRDIITMIPEFNRKFLNAPKDRYGKAYWWTPDSEEGHNARVKAFDKLIKYYELDKKNHE